MMKILHGLKDPQKLVTVSVVSINLSFIGWSNKLLIVISTELTTWSSHQEEGFGSLVPTSIIAAIPIWCVPRKVVKQEAICLRIVPAIVTCCSVNVCSVLKMILVYGKALNPWYQSLMTSKYVQSMILVNVFHWSQKHAIKVTWSHPPSLIARSIVKRDPCYRSSYAPVRYGNASLRTIWPQIGLSMSRFTGRVPDVNRCPGC